MLEFVDFQSAIRATRNRSEVAYRSCGSTMVPVTASIVRRGEALVILVAGGDKRTQSRDITTAIKLARNLWEHWHEQNQT